MATNDVEQLLKSSRPQSAKTNTSSASTDAKADNLAKHSMLYYLIEGVYIRPVAYVTGFNSKHTRGQPYPLRRSSGHLKLLPYSPTLPPPYSSGPSHPMSADLEYVTGTGVALSSRPPQKLLITVLSGARLAVLGELTGGYVFGGPTAIQMSGSLHLAHYEIVKGGGDFGLLREQALEERGLLVQVKLLKGTAKMYVCDGQHLVLLYDADSHYTVKVVGQSKEIKGGGGKDSDLINRITASQPGCPPPPPSSSARRGF